MLEVSKYRSVLVFCVAIGLSAYFVYHAIAGRHGLDARRDLVVRVAELERETARLEAIRSELARDVALLKDQSIHPDMLDEQVRSVLRYAKAGELIVLAD
jgi:cell division protein FtsB